MSLVRAILPRQDYGRYAISVVDQAVVAGSNFLTLFAMAWVFAPAGFGLYSLLFSALLLSGAVCQSLVIGPSRVFGADCRPEELPRFMQLQSQIQVLQWALVSLVFLALPLLLPGFGFTTALVLVVVALVRQHHELMRVSYQVQLDFPAVLAFDVVTQILRLGFFLAFYLSGALTVETALGAIGLGFLPPALWRWWILSGQHRHETRRDWLEALVRQIKQNYRYGRWILVDFAVSLGSSRIYPYLLGFFGSLEAVAGLAAAQTLLRVPAVASDGIIGFALPQARRTLRREGYAAWRSWLIRLGLHFLGLGFGFGLPLVFFAREIVTLVYPQHYSDYANLVPLLAISYCLGLVILTLSLAFRSSDMPQAGVIARTGALVPSLLLSIPLIQAYGAMGAAIGLLMVQIIWFALYLLLVWRGRLNEEAVISRINHSNNRELIEAENQ